MRAINNGELVLFYQPIVTATTPRRVAAVEALLRWRRPNGQITAAADFIDIAIRNGLIIDVGRWVIDQACAQARAWIEADPDSAPPIVFINLSARELNDPALPGVLAAALTRHRLPATRIGLEILEHHFSDPSILARLTQLRQSGHPLSIDDFGTGYSSLSRLIDFQVDYTKIDKAFTTTLPTDTRRAAIIGDVLNIATALSSQVIAEGVETAEQEQHLIAAGCHLFQGYRPGPPQPA